jgi:hypothetical protein
MTSVQTLVLNFWNVQGRALAVFEGKLIGPAEITADAALAQRYWDKQLSACAENWKFRNY